MARKIASVEAERIGSRLRSARQASGLTLTEVGEQCGMHYTQVSKIERGRFGRLNGNVKLLCKTFKLDPDAADGASPEELHARLDALIRVKPSLAVALRALFDAFDGMAN